MAMPAFPTASEKKSAGDSVFGDVAVDALVPYGLGLQRKPASAGYRDPALGREWKSYHEVQALSGSERQYGRPVYVNTLFWGKLMGGKLAEFIERERGHPRSYVKGGVADRKNPRCMLPPVPDVCFAPGDPRANPPEPVRFSHKGEEFTKETLGAGGEFLEVLERCSRGGKVGLSKQGGGEAGDRAKARCRRLELGFDSGGYGNQRSSSNNNNNTAGKRVAPEHIPIPWGKRAASSEEDDEDEDSSHVDSKLQSHWLAIGPRTHRFALGKVDKMELRRLEKCEGTEAFFAHHVGKRFVAMAEASSVNDISEKQKLKGQAELERREILARGDQNPYLDAAARRQHDPSSVGQFQRFFVKNKLAAHALPRIERELWEVEQARLARSETLAAARGPVSMIGMRRGTENSDSTTGTTPVMQPTSGPTVAAVRGGGFDGDGANSDDDRAFPKGAGGGRSRAGSMTGSVSSLGDECASTDVFGAGAGRDEDSICSTMTFISGDDDRAGSLPWVATSSSPHRRRPPAASTGRNRRPYDGTIRPRRRNRRRWVHPSTEQPAPSVVSLRARADDDADAATAADDASLGALSFCASSRASVQSTSSPYYRTPAEPSDLRTEPGNRSAEQSTERPSSSHSYGTSAADTSCCVLPSMSTVCPAGTSAPSSVGALTLPSIAAGAGRGPLHGDTAGPCVVAGDVGDDGDGQGGTNAKPPTTLDRARRGFSGIFGAKRFLTKKKRRSVSSRSTLGGPAGDDGGCGGGSDDSDGNAPTTEDVGPHRLAVTAAAAGVDAGVPASDGEASAGTSADAMPLLGGGEMRDGCEDASATQVTSGPPAGGKIRRWRRGRGGDELGAVGVARKIDIGSVAQQKAMDDETRTALLMTACEYGDIAAVDILLELGASPLDICRGKGSRCVFSQVFINSLQMDAGVRPREAPDASLNDLALERLFAHGQGQQQQMRHQDRHRQPQSQKWAILPPPAQPPVVITAEAESEPFLRNPKLTDEGHDERGFGLLHHAAAFGNVRKAELLLQRNADPDFRASGARQTPLMVAARRGQREHIQIAAALLQAGCSISAVDSTGGTALHHAADAGRKHMCRYLLLVGADKEAKDSDGRRPQDLCRDRHPRAYTVLQSFVAPEAPCTDLLGFMEKVEVGGLDPDEAEAELAHLFQSNSDSNKDGQDSLGARWKTENPATNAHVADTVCVIVLGDIDGDDTTSLTSSWDALSVGGLSSSAVSLGSLVSNK